MKYEVIINNKYKTTVRAKSMDEAYARICNMEGWRDIMYEATITPYGMYYKFKVWLFRLLRINREVK